MSWARPAWSAATTLLPLMVLASLSSAEERNLGFISEREKVVVPVVDYALSRPETKNGAMGLMGLSMGGFLAARTAACEHRLAGLIVLIGVDNMQQPVFNVCGPDSRPSTKPGMLRALTERIEEIIAEGSERSATLRRSMSYGLWVCKAKDPYRYIHGRALYQMDYGLYGQIKTPVFVRDAEKDLLFDD